MWFIYLSIDSNTTLVKVKSVSIVSTSFLYHNSNTTLVKVKLFNWHGNCIIILDSNTTLVKVKCIGIIKISINIIVFKYNSC